MLRLLLFLAAALLLIVNGVLHGLWTQRWSGLTESSVQVAGDRLTEVPLIVREWTGHKIETDDSLPEEVVGKNLAIRYVHRGSGNAVIVYLACGHPAVMERHTPLECYPTVGFKTVGSEDRVSLLSGTAEAAEFKVATFSKGVSPTAVHLRVFWAWKGAGSWKAPENTGRAFRASPFLYKCYAIRPLVASDEPLEGDPCCELLNDLIPQLNRSLAADG
jgi:hypothetical protein